MTEAQIRAETLLISKMAGAYASEFEEGPLFMGLLGCRIITATCRATPDPMALLESLYETMTGQLEKDKEKKHETV